jgi:Family of unknown function (DUF5670)
MSSRVYRESPIAKRTKLWPNGHFALRMSWSRGELPPKRVTLRSGIKLPCIDGCRGNDVVELSTYREALAPAEIAGCYRKIERLVRRLPDVFSASGLALCLVVDELFRPGGLVLALIGLVLLVLWLLGFVAFHVTTGVIHILLVLAIISIIIHFLRGRTVA